MKIKITRETDIPNPVNLARYERSPMLGPRVLFFSGGTALRSLSRDLIRYTHNSIHLMTPFDSGGSSAVLREAFGMPAVGDIRNRLLALADQSLLGSPEIFELLTFRLPKNRNREFLVAELQSMCEGKHPLINAIDDPMRKIIRLHLSKFMEFMPAEFDLRGANIGNLFLAAGYLENQQLLDPIIFLFSKLVDVHGTVRPIVNQNLHLSARLHNGQTITGQHRITGKDEPAPQSRITRLFLTDANGREPSTRPELRRKNCELIESADLICYPMGSFYSSLVANLLLKGVGTSIKKCHSPKVFIPSTGDDPECYDMSVTDQVETLLKYLRADNREEIETWDVLNFIIVDEDDAHYQGTLDMKKMQHLGVKVMKFPLVSKQSAPHIDESLLLPILMSLA